MLFSQSCVAGVVLGGTRVIYDSEKKEATLTLTNTQAQKSYLVQSWITSNQGSNKNLPFIITPPLFKLGANKKGILRIVNVDTSLPKDRESLYWINVKPIPSSDTQNKNELQLIVKSSIKLIYRPAALQEDAATAYTKIKFTSQNNNIDIYNPTPFYINLYSVELDGIPQENLPLVAPFSHSKINGTSKKITNIQWQAINDSGSTTNAMNATL